MAETMDDIWTRLETFLQKNAPQIYAGLAPGATEDEITKAEQRCGFPFPPDARQSYLRHDDQRPPGAQDLTMGAGGEFVPGYFGLSSLAGLSTLWQYFNEPEITVDASISDDDFTDPRVKHVYLDRAWVAFAWNIGGNAICLDFEPRPSGQIGQVIFFDHEDPFRQWLAPSFRVWLETIVSDLEMRRLVWNAELEGYEYPEDESKV